MCIIGLYFHSSSPAKVPLREESCKMFGHSILSRYVLHIVNELDIHARFGHSSIAGDLGPGLRINITKCKEKRTDPMPLSSPVRRHVPNGHNPPYRSSDRSTDFYVGRE